MKYQVTIYNLTNTYRPISTVVESDTVERAKAKGLANILHKRGWTMVDIKKYGYTAIKCREYDEKKTEAEKLIKKIANKRKYKEKKENGIL